MTLLSSTRLCGAAILAGLSLLLSACFITPGKFSSELELLENDQFSFTYEGEVHFLGLSQLAEMRQQRATPEFNSYCYGESEASADAMAAEAAAEEAAEEMGDSETVTVRIATENGSGSRDCTPEEIAEQRAEWEERQASRKARDEEEVEQFSKLIGGINPNDPDAEQQLARILTRQNGFDRVVAKGNGLFDVSYSINGTLTHDFMFPMMEDFPTINPFVQVFIRDGDVVRINAPGFAPQSSSNPMLPLMLGGMFGSGPSSKEEALLNAPKVEGTFSIVTTGEIRANNTDEGPASTPTGSRLTWTINSSSKAPPTALIAMPR